MYATWTCICAHLILLQYLRLNTSQFFDPSSAHRLARVQELPEPRSVHGMQLEAVRVMISDGQRTDIEDILGDTEDPEYPIYRDVCRVCRLLHANHESTQGKAPDNDSITVASCIFDLDKAEWSIFSNQNPKLSHKPLLVLPITSTSSDESDYDEYDE